MHSVEALRSRGVTKVRSFAWRDLDDPDAGGSEIHADEILQRWARAGLDIEHRTSARRGGVARPRPYRSIARGGRHGVFARVIPRELLRRQPADTAIVEIWNGVPWCSPLWRARAGVVWQHHVHGPMWDDALPRPLNIVGRTIETRLAPRLYRRAAVATLSEPSRDEIVAIGIPPTSITVIPPGIHTRFGPDERHRSPTPHVTVVGRLAPVKRIPEVVASLHAVKARVPELTVTVVGQGEGRAELERWIAANDAAAWVELAGRIGDDDLVRAYQRAWLVVSGSYAEGWGMSLTEGAACGTPAVATDIAGHRGAVAPDVSGVLVDDVPAIGPAVAELVADPARLAVLRRGAISHASQFSWDTVAAAHLRLLLSRVVSTDRR